jgi:phosphoribosyl 1,2-cyclic phosphodiesterase
MRFTTLGSGSAGNATLIQHGATAVLIDCGLSAREAARRATSVGFDISQIDAILLTHEHDDHVAGAGALARRTGAAVFASAGTRSAAQDRLSGIADVQIFSPERGFALGALDIAPVIVPHDAREPCQFVLTGGGLRLGVLTDLGQPTTHLARHFRDLDGLILEFNHDSDLLAASRYPHALKNRIGGDYGHLSNQQAQQLLAQLELGGLQHFVAAHLSENTNTPALVEARLQRSLPDSISWHIASQSEASPWFELAACRT